MSNSNDSSQYGSNYEYVINGFVKDKTILFTIFFILIIFIVLIITLKSSLQATNGNLATAIINIPNFMAQSHSAYLIIYILALNFFFAYMPQNIIDRFANFFIIGLIVITGYMFATSFNIPAMNPYYETPYKVLVFLCAIGLFIILGMYNPADLFSPSAINTSFVLLLFFSLFSILWFIVYLSVPKGGDSGLYSKSFMILFGLGASSTFIGWLAYVIANYSGKTGWLSIILSIFLIILVSILIMKTYQTQFVAGNREKSAGFALLSNSIMYIPCLLEIGYNRSLNLFSKTSGISRSSMSQAAANVGNNIRSTNGGTWGLLVATAALFGAYYFLPDIKQRIYLGNGVGGGNCKQLVNNPIPLNEGTSVASYSDLNPVVTDASGNNSTPTYDYNYGLSLWFYLDALGPNTSEAYMQYAPIINYGNKPVVEYNAEKDSLRIRMGAATDSLAAHKSKPRTVYEQRGVPLQKWVNLVINYAGGTVDVFMDGKLLKSVVGVAPYMSMDNLVVGEQNGLYGQVCNVIYNSKPFSMANIYYLNYLVKDSNPPVLDLRRFGLFKNKL